MEDTGGTMPRYNIGDVVRFAHGIRNTPYAGVGMVCATRPNPFDDHPPAFIAPMQICVHWFNPNKNAWYEETTITLRKVGASNEKN